MFLQDLTSVCVFYALSPLHAGSGQAIGAVDLPIQRERHTQWPQVQATGVKGAFRDWFYHYWRANGAAAPDKEKQAKEFTESVFGKDEGGESKGGQAGAIAVSDARLLAFPVRSQVAPFVWVTCPAVLTRLKRDLQLSLELEVPVMSPPEVDHYLVVTGNIPKQKVILEDLAVSQAEATAEMAKLRTAYQTLAPQVDRLLLISDQNFSFLVRTATEVQAQIKINLDTGTTVDGSLRYQELLPADSVLYSLVFFGAERKKDGGVKALAIKDLVTQAIFPHFQMGGDLTLGRGLLEVNWLPKIKKAQGGAA